MAIEVGMHTVGQIQENCFLVNAKGGTECVLIDPGAEPQRLLQAMELKGLTLAGILLTHTHFDHIGAVAPLARETGVKVWCPELEVPVLADPMQFMRLPGVDPIEGYDADETIKGGETVELAGISFDVVFTPGHSPGHVTFVVAPDGDQPTSLFSGDVLFQGSVGRTDLPFGDWPTLAASIKGLLDAYPDDSVVYPGHMGVTTLGAERATNPFLGQLTPG